MAMKTLPNWASGDVKMDENLRRRKSMATKRRNAAKAMAPPDSIATVVEQWSRQRPGLDLGPLGMFVALAHVYWLTTPRIERLMADHGISRGIFDVLTTLRRAGAPHTFAPRQISRSLLLSGAGLTSRLDRLEAGKFIARLPDPHDGRSLKVRLTPKGLRLVDRILPKLIRLEAELATGLSRKQMAQVTGLLDLWAGSVPPAGKRVRRHGG
jgi:DNA-binding MarR family transcriptional regulator